MKSQPESPAEIGSDKNQHLNPTVVNEELNIQHLL